MWYTCHTDFEEPLQHTLEHKIQHVATVADKLPNNLYVPPVNESHNKECVQQPMSTEQPKEQLVHLHEFKKLSTKPKEQSSEIPSCTSSTSVGIQCNRIDVNEMGTQATDKTTSLSDAGTQTISKSTMTGTNDLLLQLPHLPDQSSSTTSTGDRLALAQSIIVWQSLMIKLLKVDAKYS